MIKKRIMENISGRFSRNMKRLRKEGELSQEKLADLTGFHYTYISQIERGRSENFSLKNAEKIAIALGSTLNDLTK
tara:strand:- start:886 stop:1113 length:228 start_codon:yes stop_codon:yes gene_type:complete